MVNTAGKNGHGDKNYPPDDILAGALQEWANLRLKPQQKLDRLRDEYGCIIKERKLRDIEKRLNIQTVRRNDLLPEQKRQEILDIVSGDVAMANAPDYFKNKLQARSIHISRDEISSVMHEHYPEGFDKRFPGQNKKKQAPRGVLDSIGPFREVSGDGHEKLAAQALDMGGISLPIYGLKDKWTAQLLYLGIHPQIRKPGPIAHVYLDVAESFGGIPIQITLDKGTERGWVYAIHTALRQILAPDIDSKVYPDVVFLKSVHNTVIEAFWRWLRQKIGDTLKAKITKGKEDHIFNINSRNHEELFYWIFPSLIQKELDDFKTYWNTHTIRPQETKEMLSGHAPNDAAKYPELYAGKSCLIPLPKVMADAARAFLEEHEGSREECYRWVSEEFDRKAKNVYSILGSPTLNLDTAWTMFKAMSDLMEALNL